jgi:hypothetical protein
MQLHSEASGTHSLLVCTGEELSVLLGAMREASRPAYDEGHELLPGTSHDQTGAILDAALAGKEHLRHFRAGAGRAEGDFIVIGAGPERDSEDFRASETVIHRSPALLHPERRGPRTHTLLGALPDQLWILHFDLVGKYPGPLQDRSRA